MLELEAMGLDTAKTVASVQYVDHSLINRPVEMHIGN